MRLRKCIFNPQCWTVGLSILLIFTSVAGGDTASFDLIGPKVEVRVQRAGQTLPISEVPDLQAGDRLWVHANLPDTQSVRYLMIIAFLRGSTNPPPDSWFTRVETWNKSVHDEGIYVTVPSEAEEALVFLAPETGGAFSTLRNAVRGKPGAFVRAAQDLEQAGLDRLRLEEYLDRVREASNDDPDKLKSRTTLLARSLNIRLDSQCFDKPTAQQAPCLTQNTDQLVLDDAHSQSMVATLTNGAPTDLLAQISATPEARSGYYSPYVGAVVDVARILSTAHTAQYQYIPALSLPKQDELNLRLNNPPSFRNPKSVLVIGLPPIRPTVVPPLRAVDATEIFCADKPALLLPADGAPLVFATALAHNFVLHVVTKPKEEVDLPAKPDPASGGFVVDTSAMQSAEIDGEVSGILRGFWGFKQFDGPQYHLETSKASQWIVASKDASALIVGRDDTLHLQSAKACCVSEVSVKDELGKDLHAEWKVAKLHELELKIPLQSATAGTVKISVQQFGLKKPDDIPVHTYSEAARLDALSLHEGDKEGTLKGTRLDQVTAIDINGVHFTAATLARSNQEDELKLVTTAETVKLHAGGSIIAHVSLKDGRLLDLNSTVEAARPQVSMLSKNVESDDGPSQPIIQIETQNELPQEGRLTFFLKTHVPGTFLPAERIEVATSDEAFHVFLSVKDGNLTLQDSKTVFAVLDPMKLLGPSAFGPLKFRPVSADGTEGDWQPLTSIVRIPTLNSIRCVSAEKQCTLSGDKLFLLDAVSSDPDFADAVTVPDGFVQNSLTIPYPKEKVLYVKLRDDPATIDTANVPIVITQQ